MSDIEAMTASLATAQTRTPTPRDPLARYRPRSFGQPSRWRFVRDRRALYLGRIPAAPTDAQKALIDSLIELEWGALRAEAEGGLVAYREGRELRRTYLRALGDFERSLTSQPSPPPTPAEALAAVHARFGTT